MKTQRKANIKPLLDEVATSAKAHGWEWDTDMREGAKFLIEQRVETLAEHLGIAPQSALNGYSESLDANEIAETAKRALDAHKNQGEPYEPITISTEDAGRVIAALGSAARMVSVNKEKLMEQPTHWNTVGILDAAGDGTIGMGLAIFNRNVEDDTVTVEPNVVFYVHKALGGTLDLLASEEWVTFDSVDSEVMQARMADDLALVVGAATIE